MSINKQPINTKKNKNLSLFLIKMKKSEIKKHNYFFVQWKKNNPWNSKVIHKRNGNANGGGNGSGNASGNGSANSNFNGNA